MKKGIYKTRLGMEAVVARMRSSGPNQWYISGAIIDPNTGVMWLHHWSLDGESHSKCTEHDLVKE